MPVAPRIPGKATKIAYKILGMPENLKKGNNAFSEEVNKRLIYEETQRVR
jgi:hypothetical protein